MDTKTPEERALENLDKPYVDTGEPQPEEPDKLSSQPVEGFAAPYNEAKMSPTQDFKVAKKFVPINKRKTSAASEISK